MDLQSDVEQDGFQKLNIPGQSVVVQELVFEDANNIVNVLQHPIAPDSQRSISVWDLQSSDGDAQ